MLTLVAACSGKDTTVPASPVGAARIDGGKAVAIATKPVPKPGGVLKMAVVGPATLDPAQVNEARPGELAVVDLLYDGLLRHDPSAKGELTGALATAWEVSGDGLRWAFTLDPNRRFSDGRPVTSADVKASIERVASRGSASLSGMQLAPIAGFADVLAKRTAELKGVVPEGANRLAIRLDTPFSALPELLSSPVFGVVPKGFAANATPVTSGSFGVQSFDGGVLRLGRIPGATTNVDGIEVRFSKSAQDAHAAFARGEVDLAPVVSATAQELPPDASLVSSPYGASMFYGLNVLAPELSNPSLRAALLKAVDREAIRAAYFDGDGDLMTGLIPAGVRGRRDNACGAACAYDAAGARAAVTEALGGAAAPKLFVDFFTDPSGREAAIAKIIADGFTAAGVPTEARGHSFDDYRAFAGSGKTQVFRFGWVGTFPSPDAYLATLFSSAGSDNAFGLKDAQVDDALEAARKSIDESARTSRYLAAEDRVLRLAPILPLIQLRSVFVVRDNVRGVGAGPQGSLLIDAVWLG